MTTSIMVILNYNDAKTTLELVDKVKNYEFLKKIVVVDNCSTDLSYETLTGNIDSERIIVIKTQANRGYAAGNNYGIRYGIDNYKPDFIFVANPDIDVSEMTMKRMATVLTANKDYSVVAPLVTEGYNVWNLPGFTGMIESLFLLWFNYDKRKIKRKIEHLRDTVTTVGVVEGSFFAIKAEDYTSIGGLDERTFLYAEEIILARRLKDIGKKIGILPMERYHHYHSVSIKKAYNSSKRKAFHNFYDSFKIYNEFYLHTNCVQNLIFQICYLLAYLERCLFDLLMYFKRKK